MNKLIERFIFWWMKRQLDRLGLKNLDMCVASYLDHGHYVCHTPTECILSLKKLSKVEAFAKLHREDGS